MAATRSLTVLTSAITDRGALPNTGAPNTGAKVASHASMRSSRSIESSQKPPPHSRVLAPGWEGVRFGPAILVTISITRVRTESLDGARSTGIAPYSNNDEDRAQGSATTIGREGSGCAG